MPPSTACTRTRSPAPPADALVAAAGVSLLAVTITVLVFPIALVVLGAFALLGASFGFGTGLLVWSAAVSAVIEIASSAGVFAWSLARCEHRALEMVRAWPYPGCLRAAAPPAARLRADHADCDWRITLPLSDGGSD